MEILTIWKLVFLFFAIWSTTINVMRLIYKQTVPAANIFTQSISIFGFIVIQFHLY